MGLKVEKEEIDYEVEAASSEASILIVDDTPANLVVLESILSKPGQNLVKASSGKEALKILLKQDFALILLDVNMPTMNGFDTATLIRQRKNSELTPIIFITADSPSDIRRNLAYSVGAVDYIFSPIVPEILKSKVSVFVELYRKSSEIKQLNTYLQTHAKQLEQKVGERTQELLQINHQLKKEILERENAEENLKKANAELTRLNKIKSDFTSMVTHELRTPLACIKMALDSIIDGLDGPLTPMQMDTLSISKTNVERLDKLINNVLDFSKFSSGKMEMFYKKQDLKTLLSEIHAFINPVAEKKGVALHLHLPPKGIHATFDPDKIRQLVINLIDNAIKYTPQKGQVRVSLFQQEKSIFIEVKDTGIGIQKKDYEKIFEMFTQAHGATKMKGTGIGLAVCRQIAEQHQGSLTVESSPKEGSKFTFTFPENLESFL